MSLIRFGRGREYQFFRREDIRMRWDLKSATQFLNGFRGDSVAMSGLRRQAMTFGAGNPTGVLTDEHVIQVIARQMVAGLIIVALPQRQQQYDTLELAEAPPAPVAKKEARVAERPEDEPTFESDHDGVAQAAVLIAAAQAAYPFCEECQKMPAEPVGVA